MEGSLRIAVASGKGGTGKTTIATSLAAVLAGRGESAAYVDCDVEEPNGHIFLRPTIERRRDVSISVPEIDEQRCTLCGACARACRYSAILVLPKKVLTFPKLCHGCGGCSLACQERAIREVPRITGIVEEGLGPEGMAFLRGRLRVGEAMAPPVIRAVLQAAPGNRTVVIDAPPGTSCPVIESVKTADVVLLVTEPTPFGLNDLVLAVGMVRSLGLPFGVAVNRVGSGDEAVFDYCDEERIPVLLQVPDHMEIARAYSRGKLAVAAVPWLEPLFDALHLKLRELAHTTVTRPAGDGPINARPGRDDRPRPSDAVRIGHPADVPELVVVSGKGGTGKTSIVASFFALSAHAAVADCDVDAADLHLVLSPTVVDRWPFSAGSAAVIEADRCTGCGVCADACRFGAIRRRQGRRPSRFEVDPIACEGCGVCVDNCPEGVISLVASANGEWFVSDTRHGPMVHARLGIAQENSGRLVSLVRREAKALSLVKGRELLICDGSPGIGCPVIASITGAQLVVLVTEPTLSGLHDLRRVAELCRQFNVATGICVNKADINPKLCDQIEAEASAVGIPVLGRIRYDRAVTAAQIKRMAVVESGDGPAAGDIRALWARVEDQLAATAGGCPVPVAMSSAPGRAGEVTARPAGRAMDDRRVAGGTVQE